MAKVESQTPPIVPLGFGSNRPIRSLSMESPEPLLAALSLPLCLSLPFCILPRIKLAQRQKGVGGAVDPRGRGSWLWPRAAASKGQPDSLTPVVLPVPLAYLSQQVMGSQKGQVHLEAQHGRPLTPSVGPGGRGPVNPRVEGPAGGAGRAGTFQTEGTL